MTIDVTPHLNFDGEARAALAFYQSVFGGDMVAASYRDAGMGDSDRIAWGQVDTGAGFRVMAFDVWPHLPLGRGENPFYMLIRGTDADELRRYWEALAEGATVRNDFGPAAWAPLAGQLMDRFGIIWELDLEVPRPA